MNNFIKICLSIPFVYGLTFASDQTVDITCFTLDDSKTKIINYDAICGPDVVIPNTITEIGDYAFSGKNIQKVVIPKSVKNIDYHAFANNKLSKVDIPDSVIEIGVSAFANNQILDINLGNNIRTIDLSAFFNNKLVAVTIPASVVKIKDYAFCSNLIDEAGITILGDNPDKFNSQLDDIFCFGKSNRKL